MSELERALYLAEAVAMTWIFLLALATHSPIGLLLVGMAALVLVLGEWQ